MTPFEFYLLCMAIYAVVWPIVGWMAVRDKHDPTNITVSILMWTIVWGLCPLVNTVGCVVGLGIIVFSVKDIVLFKARP